MDPLLSMQDARSDADRKVKKKINYLMTECFQNIVRHSERKDEAFENFFAIRTPGNENLITTINPVRKSQKDKIISSFSSVENLDTEALRAVYLDALNESKFSDKGGAGLGIIEMARKAKKMPRYAFEKWNDEFDAFELELALSESDNQNNNSLFIPSFELYEKLRNNNVLLVQKGDFSQESVISLFGLIESNLNKADCPQALSKKMYLLIELLQNMSKNAELLKVKKTVFL